jgi:hypothetical protein
MGREYQKPTGPSLCNNYTRSDDLSRWFEDALPHCSWIWLESLLKTAERHWCFNGNYGGRRMLGLYSNPFWYSWPQVLDWRAYPAPMTSLPLKFFGGFGGGVTITSLTITSFSGVIACEFLKVSTFDCKALRAISRALIFEPWASSGFT